MNKHEKTLVRMENLSSSEYLIEDGRLPRRALESIWVRFIKGQVWGVFAPTHYEIALLLQIMANVRPYEAGRCVLNERGMMRTKRVILPHVFYIGGTDMLYESMNVLEFLMLATAKAEKIPAERQDQLFEWLIACGLGEISLTEIRWLDTEEKAVVLLMAAACSQSSIVVFNIPQLNYNIELQRAIAMVSERIGEDGKTLVIGTKDTQLIQNACTHTALLANGKIIFQGPVNSLRTHYDIYTVCIDADDNDDKRLYEMNKEYRFKRSGNKLYISGAKGQLAQDIFREILDAGIVPENMRIHSKSVGFAFEELLKKHDLS